MSVAAKGRGRLSSSSSLYSSVIYFHNPNIPLVQKTVVSRSAGDVLRNTISPNHVYFSMTILRIGKKCSKYGKCGLWSSISKSNLSFSKPKESFSKQN